MNLWAELRRRNVVRVAALYVVSSWLLIQVADTLLPVFEAPAWLMKVLVGVLAVGLVPVLVFAWVFELTPEGLRREEAVERGSGFRDHTARRLDLAVIVVLLMVGALVLWGRRTTVPEAVPADTAMASAPAAASAPPRASPAAKSIAVLPFADFSPGGDQAWFADGLTEEILNALARTPDLMVSARTSSFKYKGSTLDIPQIARELQVAHVLEGSVRSTPERVRVTAQLIRAEDGFHLWSQTYDRELADVIAIQEDLAQAIATAMQTRMDPEALAEMARVGTRSVEAYQAYLRGVAELAALQGERALEQFELARQLDPGFADAHASAAAFYLGALDSTTMSSGLRGLSSAELETAYATRMALAIEHAPDDVSRLAYRALQADGAQHWREAIALYEQYLAARPGDLRAIRAQVGLLSQMSEPERLGELLDAIWPQAQVRVDVAATHADNSHRTLQFGRAADQAVALAERWPEESVIAYQAHRALLWAGRTVQAAQFLRRYQAQADESARAGPIPEARQACAEGRRADVERLLAEVPEANSIVRWHLLHLLGRDDEAVATLNSMVEASGSPRGLAGFLSYPDFDPAPFPVLLELLAREQVQRPPPLPLPFACPPPGAPK